MKMTLNKFLAQYGYLLPAYYIRLMHAMYDHTNSGGEIIVPAPDGNSLIHIIKK